MSLKKIIAISLSLALMLLCGMPTVLADGETETGPELPAVPQVTVTGVNVENTEYFELGVKVTAGSFQSVGLILGYDTKTLVPVNWQDGSAVNVSGSGWDAPTVLMTKGADGLSGKPGLAYYAAGEGGGNTYAYVYIGASALEYKELSDEQVVTLRFQRQADDSGALKTVTMGPSADQSKTIEFAPAAVAEASIPGYQAIAFTNADTFYTEGEEWHVAFGEVTDGPGIGTTTTPSGSSGDYAVTFFDWDGRVIDAIATDPATASGDVTAFTDRLKAQAGSPLTAKKGYAFDQWLFVKQVGSDLLIQNNEDDEVFTSNEAKLPAADPSIADFGSIQTMVSGFTEDTKCVLVQAAYVAKTRENGFSEDLVNNESTGNADRYYQISEPVYSRYGPADAETGSYSLKLTVYRNSTADGSGYGVTRLRKPGVVVTMATSSGNVVNLIELENTDVATFEVVPTKPLSRISYKVVDTYGVSNWPGCADKSDPTVGKDKNTFVREGTRGFLAQQAYAVVSAGASWDSTVNAQAFADAYLGVNNQRANPTWWNDARCAGAKGQLETASASGQLNSAGVEAALNNVN